MRLNFKSLIGRGRSYKEVKNLKELLRQIMTIFRLRQIMKIFRLRQIMKIFRFRSSQLLRLGRNNSVYEDIDACFWEIDLNSSLDRLLVENNFETILKKFINFYFKDLQITAVDVGANNGYFSIPLGKISNKVYSFEANPKSFRKLKRNIELNNLGAHVLSFDLAIDKSNGVQDFFIQQSIDGDNLMNTGLSSLIPRSQYMKDVIKVKVVTLDSFIIESQQIDLIKIDVEGSEIDVLKGSINIIKNYSPLIIWEASFSIEVGKVQESFDFLSNLGYKSYFLQSENLTPKPLTFLEFIENGMDLNIISAPADLDFN
jgi:FkbM family methyltransferase